MEFTYEPFPDDKLREREWVILMNWKGSLSVLVAIRNDGREFRPIEVWCLVGDSWNKTETFDVPLGFPVFLNYKVVRAVFVFFKF